ncbi:hypothetical protein [Subtercola vilae]|uniref:hypothetical protein n=1 Tax=Subtercola vilae TaxID=2056433 RepID=UPI0010AAF388|nr:hypothetical protein [Subtercola vilae]
MSRDNPFTEREPFKKRITSVSLTAEQRAAFDLLKERTHTVTDGAMIKKALERMVDDVAKNYPAPTPVVPQPERTKP